MATFLGEQGPKTTTPPGGGVVVWIGRGDRIRTCDFYLPKVALYQAELHPEYVRARILARATRFSNTRLPIGMTRRVQMLRWLWVDVLGLEAVLQQGRLVLQRSDVADRDCVSIAVDWSCDVARVT